MKAILLLGFLGAASGAALAATSADVAYEKSAYRLELVRNQIDLTIQNHASLHQDLGKQRREQQGMEVFLRVPVASHDLKESELLASIRSDFARAAERETGYRLAKVAFAGAWQSAPRRVPAEVSFDSDYRLPEDQVVDKRLVKLDFRFTEAAPVDPTHWLHERQRLVRRWLEPVSWKRTGKRLSGTAYIYRFRALTYPKLLAPDLAGYATPGTPSSSSQKAAFARIEKYRRDIVALWPRCQPYLDDIREFAVNDARMNFFLGHVNLGEDEHAQQGGRRRR